MIFLDTSCIYALADTDDRNHAKAVRAFDAARNAGEEVATHCYVLVESAALLQRRLGLRVALAFLEDAANFTLIWVDGNLHGRAVEYQRRTGLADLSLVDAVSFVMMGEMKISHYLGFDRHFDSVGFSRYAAPDQP